MCRSIKTLYNIEPPVTEDEIYAAALQYVRKISGTTRPSQVNEAAFLAAVDEIAATSQRLLGTLETRRPPKSRADLMAKAQARARERVS